MLPAGESWYTVIKLAELEENCQYLSSATVALYEVTGSQGSVTFCPTEAYTVVTAAGDSEIGCDIYN